MRQRESLEFMVYPKYFFSLAIPYKGTYTIRIKVYYQKLLNGKVTYAYPFMQKIETNPKASDYPPSRTHIDIQNTYYDTQTFNLIYSDQRIHLNSFCVFKLEYDQLREFKTAIEFSLIRKEVKKKNGELIQGLTPSVILREFPEKICQETICRETFHLNNLKKLSCFKRVYFYHHQFYCCLDMFLAIVSKGIFQRTRKMQLVQFDERTNKNPKEQKNRLRYRPQLKNLISYNEDQISQYCWLREKYIEFYKVLTKSRKQFLHSQNIDLQTFQDLSHIKYQHQQYVDIPYQEARQILCEDKKLINNNLSALFEQFFRVVAYLPFSEFNKNIIRSENQRASLQLKYLVKVTSRPKDIGILPNFSFRLENSQSTQLLPMRNSSHVKLQTTYKLWRENEKKQFIQTRRDSFIKNLDIYNKNDIRFPMILIEKQEPHFQFKNANLQKQNIEEKSKKPINCRQNLSCLIILIHGFHGSQNDLRKIKNYLEHLDDKFKVLAITTIQREIDQSIQYLGLKIANQIQFYIENSQDRFSSISIIGFSLGGVLARSCLIYLEKYKHLMNMLITFASPHLGVSECQNRLINLGVWYLTKIDRAQNIRQLNFQSVKEDNSYLMSLSESLQIGWFRKVVLVSSQEDEFVPQYSAAIKTNGKNIYLSRMAEKITSQIQCLERVEVWFDFKKSTSFEQMIGKRSHVEFIENFAFLQMISKIYQNQL